MFCISSIGPETSPPFKLTNKPALGCCYFSDRRQETPGSEAGSLNAHNRGTVQSDLCLPSVKAPITERHTQ